MASVLKVDKLDPQSGTALEIGTSGDTVTVPTGAGLTVTDEVKTNKISPATGVAFALGDSGDTFTVPSGATIVNSGTATGFGGGKLLQVVKTNLATSATSTSGTFATILTSTSITLASASNSLLCFVSFNFKLRGNSSVTTPEAYIQLQESDNTAVATNMAYFSNLGTSTSCRLDGSGCLVGMYSPDSTSEAPLVQYKCDQGAFEIKGLDGMLGSSGGSVTSITVMEIEA